MWGVFMADDILKDAPQSHLYTYTTFTYTDTTELTRTKTDSEGNETVTKLTQNFTKTIVTAIYNSDGDQILEAKYDEKGNISGYFDSDGKEIIING